jgi:hypothetical protein
MAPQRNRAVLWLLANLITFRTQKTTRPDATGLHKLPKTDKMEDIPDGQKENERRKLPNNNRHHPIRRHRHNHATLWIGRNEYNATHSSAVLFVWLKLTKCRRVSFLYLFERLVNVRVVAWIALSVCNNTNYGGRSDMLNTSFVPYGLVRFGDLCPWWTVSRDVIALSFPCIQQTVCLDVCIYSLSVAELFFF